MCTTVTATGSWTCPPGVTSVTVQCWGGGGAGGGVNASSTVSDGGGGGGGAFAQSVVAVTAGTSYAVTIGAGGTGATAAAGGAGGATSFNGTTVVAAGGSGGGLGTNGNGTAGAGGTTGASTGTTTHSGGNGAAGANGSYHGGGGGGGAGTTANGSNATNASGGAGGATGGGTGGGGQATTNTCGTTASSPGGGGGGAYTSVVGTYAGCDGAAGQIVLCYTQSTCSGTPAAGSAAASIASYDCSGGYSTISLVGNSACGVTYQWQSSPDGSSWSNIGGATSSTYAATVTATSYYQCVVTCTSGGASSTSSSVQVASTSTVACYTCFDGVQNGTETGVDCGGTCALSCSTNSVTSGTATFTSSCSCPAAASATVYSTTCVQLGTSVYDVNSPIADFTSTCGTATAPSSISCASAATTTGAWIHVDLAPGVNQVQLSLTGGSINTGNSTCYSAAYQGTNCATLTQVSCQKTESFISGSYGAYTVLFTGLDPTKDLWIYMFNDNNKDFTLNYQLVGSTSSPPNTSCASSSTTTGSGCSLGASGASFTPPGACTGGTWSSNENTTYYSFTPTATTASLSINSITCNDGVTGTEQFAVWTSCASVGTYTSSTSGGVTTGYLGCAVGTGTISLTGLVAGQTYYIVSDGTAGSNCSWSFAATNIVILPVELLDFTAKRNNDFIDLKWRTNSETNNRFFTVEKSKDAINFQYVATVPGAGNSVRPIDYRSSDSKPYEGVSYYRLKQTDYDGEEKYSYVVSVNYKSVGVIGEIQTIYDEPGVITFVTHVDAEKQMGYTIFDVSGKEITRGNFTSIKGNNYINLPVTEYSNGMYFITVTDYETQKQQKFIKY